MLDDKAKALSLKTEGNRFYQKGDWSNAESRYSQALILDPKFSALYTNRATARFHLSDHEGAIADCDACLLLDPRSVKAHYFKSRSLFALGYDPDAACEEALTAYQACLHTDDKSLQMTAAHLLKCRNDRWERREKKRRREAQNLEKEVLDMLGRETRRDIDDAEGEVEKDIIREEGEKKADAMRSIFERARKEDDKKRDVPEWLIDDISFNVMTDPVTTHTGRSYDRASIQAAINHNAIDPVTREPLAKGELIPNVVLKQACEWFLDSNGWAYDW